MTAPKQNAKKAAAKIQQAAGLEPKSVATQLVEIARRTYTLGVSTLGEPYAIPTTGPKVVHMFRGSKLSLRAELGRLYFERTGRAATQQARTDAIGILEGYAFQADPKPLAVRVARAEGALWLDLGDATGRAVRIDGEGWDVTEDVPVLFRRTKLTGELPTPERGLDIDHLWMFVRVTPEDRPLVLADQVGGLDPDIPHPVIGITGEHGSAKTSATRTLTSLADPSPVPVRKAPRDSEAWVTAASGSWRVGLDNVWTIPEWLSDSLCRASTGEGDVRRQLYTDDELHVFAFRRAVIVNGIDLGTMSPDLMNRMLAIELDRISDDDRREETELAALWPATWPYLLGALLTLASEVLAVLDDVTLTYRPRMLDFARYLAAVDKVRSTNGTERYRTMHRRAGSGALSADEWVQELIGVIASAGGTAEMTAAEIKKRVEASYRDPFARQQVRLPGSFPASPTGVTRKIKKLAPVMREQGWTVEHASERSIATWTLTLPVEQSVAKK
jgi:hypothetical protein